MNCIQCNTPFSSYPWIRHCSDNCRRSQLSIDKDPLTGDSIIWYLSKLGMFAPQIPYVRITCNDLNERVSLVTPDSADTVNVTGAELLQALAGIIPSNAIEYEIHAEAFKPLEVRSLTLSNNVLVDKLKNIPWI